MFKKSFFIFLISQCFFSLCMEKDPAVDNANGQGLCNRAGDYQKEYPLHYAIKKGRLKQVRERVLHTSINLNSLDDEEKSLLYFACLYREYRIIKLLIAHGADKASVLGAKFLSKPDYEEVAELLALEKIPTKSFVEILNGRLCRLLRDRNVFGAYLLMAKYSAIGKDLAIDLKATDAFGKSLLFLAVEKRNIRLMKRFIQANLDVNARDSDGKPLILYAVETGDTRLMNELLLNGAKLDVVYKNGNALDYVSDAIKGFIKKDDSKTVKFLLSLLSSSDVVVSDLINSYIEQTLYDDPEMLKVLFEHGVKDINKDTLVTLFHSCIEHKKYECIKFIRLFADVHEIDIEEEVRNDFDGCSKNFFAAKNGAAIFIEKWAKRLRYGLVRRQREMRFRGRSVFSPIKEEKFQACISKAQMELNAAQDRYNKKADSCCALEILRSKFALVERVQSLNSDINSIAEAIDSNNLSIFMEYIYADQSGGRGPHIAIIPKFQDLFYAISLNPDTEIAKLKVKDHNYSRGKYVENLCTIIDSILLLGGDALVQQLITPKRDAAENIIHFAACYSCHEVLEHLLRTLSEYCNEEDLSKLINARNKKKETMLPLEIAAMAGSDEKIEILYRFGAKLSELDPRLIHNKKNAPLIKMLYKNRHNLAYPSKVKKNRAAQGVKNGIYSDLATIESAPFRKKVAIVLSGIGVAALVAYQLFRPGKIISTRGTFPALK